MAVLRHEIDYLAAAYEGRRTAIGDLDRRVRPAPADEPALPVGTPGGWRHAAAGADYLVCIELSSGKPKRMPAEFIDGYGQALCSPGPEPSRVDRQGHSHFIQAADSLNPPPAFSR